MEIIDLIEPVLIAHAHSTVPEMVRTMVDRKIDVAVVLEGKQPTGIVTEKELVERMASAQSNPPDGSGLRLGEVARAPETTDRSTTILAAARRMRDEKIRHLVLVDGGGGFVGLVGLRRVLLEVVDELDLKLDNLERELMADGPGG